MKLPDKLNRKAVVANFDNVGPKTWEHFFDHEKENGLYECRTEGFGGKHVWYLTPSLQAWLVSRGLYRPHEFEERKPGRESSWAGLRVTRHAISA